MDNIVDGIKSVSDRMAKYENLPEAEQIKIRELAQKIMDGSDMMTVTMALLTIQRMNNMKFLIRPDSKMEYIEFHAVLTSFLISLYINGKIYIKEESNGKG